MTKTRKTDEQPETTKAPSKLDQLVTLLSQPGGVDLATMMTATGWQILDPVMAVLAALGILWSGWSVIRQSFSGLMDEAVTADILAEIQRVIAAEATGAHQAHDLRTRHAGRATFIAGF